MENVLRVLMLENMAADAELIEHELRQAGTAFSAKRVDTREAFIQEFNALEPDIVIAAHKPPDVDGMAALEWVRHGHPEVPVIMVGSALADTEIIEMIQAGAADCVLRDRPSRLAPVIHRALLVAQEVRARKTAEQALRESEARYKRIIDGLTDYQYTVHIKNGCAVETVQSPACAKVTGYEAEEFAANPHLWIEMVAPEDREMIMAHVQQILAGKDVPPMEHRIIRKDGKLRWVSDTTILSRDASGTLQSYDGVIEDITERKLTEQKLAESEAYFRSLFENMLEGYAYCRMIYDGDIPDDWIYLDTNPSFEKLTGLKNVIGSHVSETIPGLRESNPELFEIFGRIVRTGVPEQFDIHVGALNAWFAVSAFRPEQECFVAVFDNITARKADEEKIRRQGQLYSALSLCNESIIRSHDEAELFPQVCRAAVQHGGMMMAWIGLLDEASKLVRPVACYGEGTAFLHDIRISIDADDPYGCGPTGTAIREDMPFWCQDYQHDPATGPWHERGAQYGWRASASLPLHRKGAAVGNLTLYADTINAFDDDSRKLLVEMASDISFALNNFAYEAERKQSLKLLEEREQHFRAITESANDAIITTAASADNIVDWNAAAERIFGYTKNEVVGQPLLRLIPERYRKQHSDGLAQLVAGGLPHIIGKTVELFGLRKDGSEFPLELSLSQWESGHGMYFTAVIRDISARKQAELLQQHSEQRFHILIEQSIAGAYIIQDGKFIYLNPRFYEIHGFEANEGLLGSDPMEVVAAKDRGLVANYMSALLDGKMHGVSYIYTALRKDGTSVEVGANSSQAYFQERPAIIGLMQDISDKKVAEEQIKRYAAQLQITFMQTVGLATTLSEMRDPYTAGHERRVADIAVAIGVEMGLDAQQLEGLKVGGYLHDVGKTAIPIEVLVKPGRFTPVEYEMVKAHARSGYEVLKEVEFPWPVAQMAFQHHERMDGSGYPRGLKGEDILLEARILAVADVVEAMASHRPYRPGLGINAALAEIERGRGSAYDPAAAAACLRLFHEKGYVLPGN